MYLPLPPRRLTVPPHVAGGGGAVVATALYVGGYDPAGVGDGGGARRDLEGGGEEGGEGEGMCD